MAQSNAWPDFKLGPSLQTQSGSEGNEFVGGVNISLTLPILSQNRGNIQYAKKDQHRATVAYQLALNKNQNERKKLIERYQLALQSLNLLQSTSSLKTNHQNIEKYFEKGLISTSLVIESHRQIFELTESIHQQELTALDALWRLFIIDGKFLSEKI
jgi:cobalt-zinc-cadmium efflux system outer membrane protein